MCECVCVCVSVCVCVCVCVCGVCFMMTYTSIMIRLIEMEHNYSAVGSGISWYFCRSIEAMIFDKRFRSKYHHQL